MKKLFFSFLLLLPFIASNNVFAEEIPNDEIWYTSTDGKVVPPYTTSSYCFGVTIVSNTYSSGKGIIKFNGNVTSIGASAFQQCKSLASIEIPNTVKSIGKQAFYCSNISSITIPNSVTSIGESAFGVCSSLTSISIPNSVKSIGGGAFSSCTKLADITIPNSVTSIGEYAFANCSSLTSITISDSVTSIGSSTFWGCSSLTSITIPNSVKSIGMGAFESCSSLASITIPKSVTNIEKGAFYGCSNLTEVYCYAEQIPSTGDIVFYNVPLSSATLYVPHYLVDSYKITSPWSGFGTITELPQPNDEIWYTSWDGKVVNPNKTYAFGVSIVSNTYTNGKGIIKFNGNVTTIGEDAFEECYTLCTIKIPNSVKNIGEYAFFDCSSLTSITIPNSVTSIDKSAFSSCSSLVSITIPDSVTIIENNVFYNCSSLTSITIPNSVTSIGGGAFSSCNLSSIVIPKSVESIGDNPFANNINLASIVVVAENTTFDSRDNSNAIIRKSDNTLISGCKNTIIPDSIKCIGGSAFSGCSSLTSIIIPNLVTSIGNYAFSGCSSLTSITIPNFVTTIGYYAFYKCSNLRTVYCYADEVPSTDKSAFKKISLSYATLYVPKNSIDSYTATSPWSGFGTITNIPEPNVFITDLSDNTSKIEVKSNDTFFLSDNIKSIEITDTISSVNLTYTRNFSDAMVNNWQAWYMPCDFDYDDLSEDFDVAEIAGVLFDKDGQNYVAFRKMTEGTVKAHTPYVVRAKEAGDAVITATTTLQPTSGAKSFSMQSAYNNFTFGGVYENSYLSAEQPTYALAKNGNFAMMGETVYLRPFRIYMRITDREDNPYAAVITPQEVKVVVIGEDDTTGLTDLSNSSNLSNLSNSSQPIYNLAGQKLQKLQKGINIVNGKKILF